MKRTDFPDWGKDLGQRLKDTEESLPEDFFAETMDLIHRRRNRRRIVISLLSSAAVLIVVASLGGLWSRDKLPIRHTPRQLPGGTNLVAQSTPEKEPAPDLPTLSGKVTGKIEVRNRRASREVSRSTPDRTPQPSTSGKSRAEVTNSGTQTAQPSSPESPGLPSKPNSREEKSAQRPPEPEHPLVIAKTKGLTALNVSVFGSQNFGTGADGSAQNTPGYMSLSSDDETLVTDLPPRVTRLMPIEAGLSVGLGFREKYLFSLGAGFKYSAALIDYGDASDPVRFKEQVYLVPVSLSAGYRIFEKDAFRLLPTIGLNVDFPLYAVREDIATTGKTRIENLKPVVSPTVKAEAEYLFGSGFGIYLSAGVRLNLTISYSEELRSSLSRIEPTIQAGVRYNFKYEN